MGEFSNRLFFITEKTAHSVRDSCRKLKGFWSNETVSMLQSIELRCIDACLVSKIMRWQCM